MPALTVRRSLSLVFALHLALLGSVATAATSGDNGTHDPSRLLQSDGRFYFYSTGGGAKSSADGLAWKSEVSPPWVHSLANDQGIWAPDGIYLNGLYYLYGSMWSSAKASEIVLLTSPTLNPSSPDYKWTDRGVVVAGPAGVTHSVIDPAPILDNDGNLWVVWGGGYPFSTTADSIFLTRLDNKTGLPLTTDPSYKPPNSPGYALEQGHKEGSYLYFHSGYYYLFWQTGSCCSGTSSTYEMHVARSPTITGGYSADRVFYASTGNVHGPGHIGIYSACGQERFTYHYYPSGGSILGENALTWSSDGWPQVGAEATTPLKFCATSGPYGAGTDGGGGTVGAGGTGAAGAVGAAGAAGAVDNGGGGFGGTAGASQGGSTASGGLENTSGATTTSGGSTALGGTSGVAASAGTTSVSGSAPIAQAGSAVAPADGGAGAAGCGCALPRHSSERGAWGLLALAALALAAFRRAKSGRPSL